MVLHFFVNRKNKSNYVKIYYKNIRYIIVKDDYKLKRIDFIDAFKGIGVFFVIFGHMPIRPEMYSYVFSFQLAIFFFVGGFLYRDAHVMNTFTHYLKKKILRIIIPYFVLGMVSIIVYSVYSEFLGKEYSVLDMILKLFISKRNEMYFNVPLWFLTSFFLIEVMYYILKCFFNNFIIGILVLIFGFIGVVVFRTTGSLYTLPWTFDASLYFIIYYFVGDMFSRGITYSNRNINYFFKSLILVFFISIIVNVMNLFNLIKHADIIYYDFGFVISLVSYLFHVFISLTGVFTYLFLAYLFRWINILKFIGRNSLYYFSFHIPIYYILYNEGIFDSIFKDMLSNVTNINFVGIIYSIFLIFVITPIIWIINFIKKILLSLKD